MKFKDTVKSDGVKPQMWFGVEVAESLLKHLGGPELTVTSMMDGKHSASNTLHPLGRAADLRTRDIPTAIFHVFVPLLKRVLCPLGFDVVPESDHLHVEYDPKEERILF